MSTFADNFTTQQHPLSANSSRFATSHTDGEVAGVPVLADRRPVTEAPEALSILIPEC
jgi:hypothetical protein